MWYTKDNLLNNLDTVMDKLASEKNPIMSVINKPFISQFEKYGHFDVMEWNYMFNSLIDYTIKYPLRIFTKSHAFKLRKRANFGAECYFDQLFRRYRIGSLLINPKMFNKYTQRSVLGIHLTSKPLIFWKNSPEYAFKHWKDIARLVMSKDIDDDITRNVFTDDSEDIDHNHSKQYLEKEIDYVKNYLINYMILNPEKVFNKTGYLHINHTKSIIDDTIMQGCRDFEDNDYNHKLIDYYIPYKKPKAKKPRKKAPKKASCTFN